MMNAGVFPRDLLISLRIERGYGRDRLRFAELTGWTYDQLRNLESARTKFRRKHLEALVGSGWFSEGGNWYERFEAAMVAEATATRLTSSTARQNAYIITEPDLNHIFRIALAHARK